MRSGHLGRGAWLAWTILCTWLCVTTVHAQSSVVCAGVEDAELLARIRGQTRDLPISLTSSPAPDLSQPSAAQLQAIAREQAADFVVSVDQEPNGSRTVYIFDAHAAELRVRAAPAPDRKQRFARSAAAETVALIVRGELADALAARASQKTETEGQTAPITDAPPQRVSPPAVARAPERATASQPAARKTRNAQAEASSEERSDVAAASEHEHEHERESSTSDSDSVGPARLSVELAARASTPLESRYFFGAGLNLRLSFDYFSVGITGSSTLPDRKERQGLALTLREHGIGLELLAHLPLSAAIELGLGAAGRVLFYRRSAESGNTEWNPEPANTSSTFAIGPQAELRWLLVQHLGVSIRIGLDVLLRPISWRYRLDTNTRDRIELERQDRTQPWLSVGVYGSM